MLAKQSSSSLQCAAMVSADRPERAGSSAASHLSANGASGLKNMQNTTVFYLAEQQTSNPQMQTASAHGLASVRPPEDKQMRCDNFVAILQAPQEQAAR